MCLTALWEMNPPATALNSALSELYTSDMWLPSEQASRVAQLGLHFLRPSSPWQEYFGCKTCRATVCIVPKAPYGVSCTPGLAFCINTVSILSVRTGRGFCRANQPCNEEGGTRAVISASLRRYFVHCHAVWRHELY